VLFDSRGGPLRCSKGNPRPTAQGLPKACTLVKPSSFAKNPP